MTIVCPYCQQDDDPRHVCARMPAVRAMYREPERLSGVRAPDMTLENMQQAIRDFAAAELARPAIPRELTPLMENGITLEEREGMGRGVFTLPEPDRDHLELGLEEVAALFDLEREREQR